MEAFRKIYPEEFQKKFLIYGVRPDGRYLNKVRKTIISSDPVSNSDGSSFVKLGNTSVTAGITIKVEKPTISLINYQPTMDENGEIIINVELTSVSGPQFRSGKSSEQAIEISNFLNSFIKNIHLISFPKVIEKDNDAIKKDSFLWFLYVNIYSLSYDGNIGDACLIALLSALKNVKLPKVFISDKEEIKLILDNNPRSLQINHYPIPLTFAIIDEFILADPTYEEEQQMSGILTIICNKEGKLYSIIKPGGTYLQEKKIIECIHIAKGRAEQIFQLLHSS